MIKYYCDACDKEIKPKQVSTLQIARSLQVATDVYRPEAHLCAECTKRALNPILEVGKKYRAREKKGDQLLLTELCERL